MKVPVLIPRIFDHPHTYFSKKFGKLKIGEKIVLIAVASKHREESLESIEFIINWLKIKATFWKKEISNDNTTWVKQKESDIEKVKKI